MKLPDFSPESVQDLKGILRHVSVARPDAARNLVQRLKEKCHFLATTPFAGEARDELSPGFASLYRWQLRYLFSCN
jgi:plasmid stabilization system protein ParE